MNHPPPSHPILSAQNRPTYKWAAHNTGILAAYYVLLSGCTYNEALISIKKLMPPRPFNDRRFNPVRYPLDAMLAADEEFMNRNRLLPESEWPSDVPEVGGSLFPNVCDILESEALGNAYITAARER